MNVQKFVILGAKSNPSSGHAGTARQLLPGFFLCFFLKVFLKTTTLATATTITTTERMFFFKHLASTSSAILEKR